jgi:glycolate oxidase iron-sulfur subunit
MKTDFTPGQLADPATSVSAQAIRKCVHCGFCTATCPTYVLLGDERDSPRGRISLMKEMLEKEMKPTAEVVRHIDRCLSCLSCTTTCPSGVDYMHLVDHSRAYIEERYERPLPERILRWTLAKVLPYRKRFRVAVRLGRLVAPLIPLLKKHQAFESIVAMLKLSENVSAATAPACDSPTTTNRRGRVLMMQGCAESVVRPQIRAGAIRLLNRVGYDVIFARDEQCCGALVHHMGRQEDSLELVRRNVDVWTHTIDATAAQGKIDAIVITTSGCGTLIKDYGFVLRNDPDYAAKAERISNLAKDVTELLHDDDMQSSRARPSLRIAYHAACSLQHGQKIVTAPMRLLEAAGFEVRVPLEAHLCCGSAGTYNILQPQIAAQLGHRKASNLAALNSQVIATGNIGCATQIASHSTIPIVHTVELLDWATGGPMPDAMIPFLAAG